MICEDVIHIYNGILLSHKKEWNDATCSNMDEPRDCHTKGSLSQTEKDKHDITYMWNLNTRGTNELIYKIEIEPQI